MDGVEFAVSGWRTVGADTLMAEEKTDFLRINKRIGELLIEAGLVTEEQVDRIIAENQGVRKRLGEILIDSGIVSETDFAQTLSTQLDIEFIDLNSVTVQRNALELFPRNFAEKHLCIPLNATEDRILVAMSDPLNLIAMEDLELSTRRTVEARIATKSQVEEAIKENYPKIKPPAESVADLEKAVQSAIADAGAEELQTRIFSVVSNKGGVGKTHVAVNMAYCIAKRGKKVLLIDGDLGNANVGIKVGIYPHHNLLDFFDGTKEIDEIITESDYGFDFIGGVSGDFKLANLNYAQKLRFVRNFHAVSRDYEVVVFDLGAGIHRTTLDFALAADQVIILTTPQDIVSGYACLKASFYRHCQIEKGLTEKAQDYDPELVFRPKVIINQVVQMDQAEREFSKIVTAASKHAVTEADGYELDVGYLGGIVYDKQYFREAEQKRRPFVELYPNRKASQCIHEIVARMVPVSTAAVDMPASFQQRFRRFVGIIGRQ